MEQYCNTHEYTLRHSDFDFKDELKLSSLLALLQESAGFSADELGFGYLDLKSKNLAFIIVNTCCEILRPVRLGEKATVETWPLPPRHVIYERDSRVRVGEEVVANVATRWCLVDPDEFRLLTPDRLGEANARCPYRAERTLEVDNWKIPKLTEGKEIYRMRVGVSQCDHYKHVNNTRYADFFCDCFTMDALSRPVRYFQIAYGKQAKEGAEISFFRKDEGDSSVCEARSDGEVLAQFRIRFGEERA